MKDVEKASTNRPLEGEGLDDRHRDAGRRTRQKRGDILGLKAFEKISAVEGVRLSGSMRRDLRSLESRQLDEDQRSRFIIEKYGRT